MLIYGKRLWLNLGTNVVTVQGIYSFSENRPQCLHNFHLHVLETVNVSVLDRVHINTAKTMRNSTRMRCWRPVPLIFASICNLYYGTRTLTGRLSISLNTCESSENYTRQIARPHKMNFRRLDLMLTKTSNCLNLFKKKSDVVESVYYSFNRRLLT